MNLIEIKNLSLSYGASSIEATNALSNIDLSIKEGEFVVVLGASGCGKTSLLNLIAGFLYPSEGEVLINNEVIKGPGPDRGVVFQKNALMPWLNVKDNIELGLKFQGVHKLKREEICDKVLDWVSLSDFKNNYIYELSGGMQQRVGIARGLASDPSVLLMDEPLGALDALTRQDVQEVILKVWHKSKKTIFMITHSIEEALFMATRLIIMTPRPGKISENFDLNFSQRYLDGMSADEIKREQSFIDLKNHILKIVHEGNN